MQMTNKGYKTFTKRNKIITKTQMMQNNSIFKCYATTTTTFQRQISNSTFYSTTLFNNSSFFVVSDYQYKI